MSEQSDETDVLTYSAIEALLPAGWELDAEIEGGQPNGSGEIEESNYREWFRPERETHHRTVITLTGPWAEGPTEYARRAQVRAAEERDRKADDERAEYERLRAIYEPTATTTPPAEGSGYCPDGCTWPHDHRFERDGVPWPARAVTPPEQKTGESDG